MTASNGVNQLQLKLVLLGGFRAGIAGQIIPDAAWERPKAKTLVKLLATTPGHRLHREQVQDHLWPELDPDDAQGRFRRMLHLARHALEPDRPARGQSSFLHMSDDLVWLDSATVLIDIDTFESEAQAALASTDVERVTAALARYPGDLLPEDLYEDWAAERRDALIDLHSRLLLHGAALDEAADDFESAIDRLQETLRRDTLREDLHRRIMQLSVQAGSRHGALRQYQICRGVLRDQLEVEPEPETEELYRAIVAGRIPARERGPASSGPRTALDLPAPLRQKPTIPLVGRERPMELLLSSLGLPDGSGQRRDNVILIGGEAGIGKTRLVTELAHRAAQHGVMVLWGPSYEHEGQSPYGPFVEALESALALVSAAERQRFAHSYPALVRLLPTLGTAVSFPTPLASARTERSRMFTALRLLVQDLADFSAGRSLLIVLDDVHLADTASLRFFHHLARSPAPTNGRVLVVATYRTEDVLASTPFAGVMPALMRAGLCQSIDLLRLPRTDCDRLVSDLLTQRRSHATLSAGEPNATANSEPPTAALLENIYALSLGNPLFATELARVAGESQEPAHQQPSLRGYTERPVTVVIPETVRALVEGRVRRLGDNVQRTLGVAAMAGATFSFDLIADVVWETARLSQASVLDSLDRALEARILEETDTGYAFRHPLFRSTLYERLSARRRLQLHAALGRALEAQDPANVEAIAYAYIRSADAHKAIFYSERAADHAAAVHAYETAEALYEEVLERIPADDTAGRARVKEKLGVTLVSLARYDDALVRLEEAHAAYREAHHDEGFIRTLAHIGQVHSQRGSPNEGLARVAPVARELEGSAPSAAQGLLQLSLAYLYFGAGMYADQLTAADRAAHLARICDDTPTLAQAETRRGIALVMLGRTQEAQQVLDTAIPIAAASNDLLSLHRALNALGELSLVTGELGRSRTCREQALAVAERIGDPARIAFTLASCALVALVSGGWAEARALSQRALHSAVDLETSSVAVYLYLPLAELSEAEGDWEMAADYLDRALPLARDSDDLQALRWIAYVHAEHDLAQGRARDAIARVEPVLDRPGFEEVDVLFLLPVLARAYLQEGQVQRAAEIAAQATQRCHDQHAYVYMPEALRARALVAHEQGNTHLARKLIDEAISTGRTVGYRIMEGRALQSSGRLHLAEGAPAPAKADLEAARALFRELGARRDLAQVENELRDIQLVGQMRLPS